MAKSCKSFFCVVVTKSITGMYFLTTHAHMSQELKGVYQNLKKTGMQELWGNFQESLSDSTISPWWKSQYNKNSVISI